VTDPVLHAHFDGANGSNAFVDVSGRHTLTAGNGGAGSATLGTARPQFGSAALELTVAGATGPYVDITGNLADFDFGSGNFTIRGWFKWDGKNASWSSASLLSYHIAGNNTTAGRAFAIRINAATRAAGVLEASVALSTTGLWTLASDDLSVVTVGTASTHTFAFMRIGTGLYLILDGALVSSATIGSGPINALASSGGILRIGTAGGIYNDGYKGMVDELQIIPAAMYPSSGYTPETAPYPTICNATGFFTTNFGTPTTAYIATGFFSTHFGTPTTKRIERATGWLATNFGTPLSRQLCAVTSVGRTVSARRARRPTASA
jgi:hypothetical protein